MAVYPALFQVSLSFDFYPSNTFFLHRHNFFSSCIAEIRRSFDSNGLLRSEFALMLYFNKLASPADWLAGLAEERAALGWRVF